MKEMFHKFEVTGISFEEISETILFLILGAEHITNGRVGSNLVDVRNDLIPLVRTTTIYTRPHQKFLPIHYHLINKIREISGIDNLQFNNAMIEIYDYRYRTMGYHTDISLDLEPDSYICLFSCYLSSTDIRKLIIKSKETGERSEILLTPNSCVLFSVETNSKYVHKIILDTVKDESDKWLGITFRLSKTMIRFIEGVPHFQNGGVLCIAEEHDRKDFFKHKGSENQIVNYQWPEVVYTLNASDMLPIS
jgi:hypothetical protein